MIAPIFYHSDRTTIIGLKFLWIFRMTLLLVNRADSYNIELGFKIAWMEFTLGTIVWDTALEGI